MNWPDFFVLAQENERGSREERMVRGSWSPGNPSQFLVASILPKDIRTGAEGALRF